jgi:hypothetical protein
MIFIVIAIIAVLAASYIARKRGRIWPNWVSLLYLLAFGCLAYGLYRLIY